MDISIFKKIGLNEKEIKIYLSLLKSGALSVRALADLSEINRGTVYDILKKLQDERLVSYYHKGTKQKFVAESPEKILTLLKAQEDNLNKTKKDFKKILPELKALEAREEMKPTTKFYEDKSGVKTILEDVLETMEIAETREYYIYSATNVSTDINNAFPNFTKARIKKNIKVKAISLAKGGKLSGLDERKWLGTEESSATFILIYGGKVAYISRDGRGVPVGVIIENENIYQTQKIIFINLWKSLK